MSSTLQRGSATGLSVVGVVVIGRNEGERLRRCIDSVITLVETVVYVDSGSTDDSISMAESTGAEIVALDMGEPFTASRARNAGVARLLQYGPHITFVQFVDGDCELAVGWIAYAKAFLDEHPDVACVCGRLRERFPERSLYNRLCDIEWDRPAGETAACGGIAMMRIGVFAAIGGFNETLIAGEEPELCLRIRAQGGRVWRVADEMAKHDAAMTRFSQWWRRTMRGGYAAAQGTSLHRGKVSADYRRKLRKIVSWSVLIPAGIAVLSAIHPWCLSLVAVYPVQVARLAHRAKGDAANRWLGAAFVVLANFPEAAGAAKFLLNRANGRPGKIIEYR